MAMGLSPMKFPDSEYRHNKLVVPPHTVEAQPNLVDLHHTICVYAPQAEQGGSTLHWKFAPLASQELVSTSPVPADVLILMKSNPYWQSSSSGFVPWRQCKLALAEWYIPVAMH
jgi:hypothetical protein